MAISLTDVATQFQFAGPVVTAVPYGTGHINRTYALRCAGAQREQRYLLQAINTRIFREPAQLMANTQRITEHLRGKIAAVGGDPARETLTLIPTVAGTPFYRAADDTCWRAFLFIEGAQAYEMALNPAHVFQAGRAVGRFQALLADFPASALYEVIPDFHHTPKRLAAFRATAARDAVNRAAEVRAEIRFIEARAAQTSRLVDLLAQGRLPLRVTHNDTKFSNVLLDDVTGAGLCVIDLDTVMPGTAVYDFADAVRAGAALAAEDEPDSARAGLSLETFEALTQGYLDTARTFLTPVEVDQLVFAAWLITLEQAIRFLGDHLNGDVYYKVQRAGHNLDRTRTQLRMLQDMEDKFDAMTAIVARYG